MKHIRQLHCAWGWWRIGVSASKAWQLAQHNVKKANYTKEILVLTLLALAYSLVAWNDAEAAKNAYTTAMVQKNKAEIALVNLLSGKTMLVDKKSFAQCYLTETM